MIQVEKKKSCFGFFFFFASVRWGSLILLRRRHCGACKETARWPWGWSVGGPVMKFYKNPLARIKSMRAAYSLWEYHSQGLPTGPLPNIPKLLENVLLQNKSHYGHSEKHQSIVLCRVSARPLLTSSFLYSFPLCSPGWPRTCDWPALAF